MVGVINNLFISPVGIHVSSRYCNDSRYHLSFWADCLDSPSCFLDSCQIVFHFILNVRVLVLLSCSLLRWPGIQTILSILRSDWFDMIVWRLIGRWFEIFKFRCFRLLLGLIVLAFKKSCTSNRAYRPPFLRAFTPRIIRRLRTLVEISCNIMIHNSARLLFWIKEPISIYS
jgi:hypothetical protein